MRAPLRILLLAFLVVPIDASAQLGRRLEEVRGEDLWTSFGLERTAPGEPVSAGAVVRFRPAAARFAPLVLVTVGLDSAMAIRRMELSLARDHVAHPREGMLAREVARSFLRAALPPEDLPDMEALVREIEQRGPRQGSAAYDVYLGRAASFERTLEACTVGLRNAEGRLMITVAARE